MKLTILMLRLRMSGAVPLLLLDAFMGHTVPALPVRFV